MTEQIVSNLTIKQVAAPEVNLVAGLFNQYRIFYKQLSDIGMAKAYLEARLENNESIIFVAIADDQPVGFTQLYPKYSSAKLTKNWILNDLFVALSHRKKGIGAALIKTAMDFAKAQGSTFLQLETGTDNYAAQSLYEAIGFKKQEEDSTFFLYKIGLNTQNRL
jgi:ribosomal protein S18 acetylase RimI-like enzyme